MKQARIFQQYFWLVAKLRQHGGLTLEELGRLWVDDNVADGNPLSRTTFNRHRDAVADLFGVNIDCDSRHRYFISNPQTIGDDSVEGWMLSTLTVGGVLLDGMSIKERILLEEVPAGEEFLHTLITAIRQQRRVMMGYQRFGQEGYVKEVSPLAVKLFHRRWYLLAFTGHHMATYSLDRMTSLQLTEHTAEAPEDFSPQRYFSEYFGVLTDGTPLEHVVVRAWGRQADYLRTLPLHHSQREVHQGDGSQGAAYADFSFDIRPTRDFVGELLSRDEGLEVLEPVSLRQQVEELIGRMAARYRR